MQIIIALAIACLLSPMSMAADLNDDIKSDYDRYLADLFDHFHRNPELSLVEHQTAERMARELRAAGFDVTENVGGLGVVAVMKNGAGPLVMMRADMDGLPVEEKSGLANASKATQEDPIVLGAQIVLALQTLVSRELAPREPGVVTVGSFVAGTLGSDPKKSLIKLK